MWPDDFGGGDGLLGQTQPVVSQPRQPDYYQAEPYEARAGQQDRGSGWPDAPHPVPGLGGQRPHGQPTYAEQPYRRQPYEQQSYAPQPHGREPAGRALGGRGPRRRRSTARTVAFGFLLSAGLLGLAVAAVGIAHQLLPRQFTPAQQRAISNWEMERRWQTLPAGEIFPAAVSYAVPEQTPGTVQNLDLTARLLSIRDDKTCAGAVTGAATRIFTEHGCSAALQATYVDATGSMVATVAVAVLPDSAAARAVVSQLASTGGGLVWDKTRANQMVRVLRVARTAAASFGDHQRQLSQAASAGPYVILSSAGFSDGRPWMRLGNDSYLQQEMVSFTTGLIRSAGKLLGTKPPAPTCPGAPGC